MHAYSGAGAFACGGLTGRRTLAHPARRATHAILFLFLLRLAAAQTPHQPVTVEGDEVRNHLIGRAELVHEKLQPRYTTLEVVLNIVVNESGEVESMRPVEGFNNPQWAIDQAEAMEKTRRFKPFTRNGVAVYAAFRDRVWIVPPIE